MFTFRKVLFPVDLSPRCVATAPYIAAIARKFESELFLLHVFSVYDGGLPYGAASPTVIYAGYEHAIRQQRTADMESFGREEFKCLKVTRTVEIGEVSSRITHYADEHGIDLIIMPTHGHGRFRRLLLGSVTSKVLHDTACPVWTTAHSEELISHSAENVRSIVCAVDLCSSTVHVIRAATDIAKQYGAVVRLVHAIPHPDYGPGVIEDASFRQFIFDTANEKIADLQHEAETPFNTWVQHGSIPTVIRETALTCDSQLVVIGRGRTQQFLGGLRTHASAIIRESPCPVLSV
jgi:nucleotide-binding universal stress UspA family protein